MATARSMPRSPRHGSTTSPRRRRCPSNPVPLMSSISAITIMLGGPGFDQEGCRIVTRFKRNTPLAVIEELAVAADSAILSDRIGFLPYRQGAGRRNPMRDAVREIQVKTETGKVLRILSNDLDAPAPQIAELYKRRWAIEAVLPLGQADPEDHPLPRHQRKCRQNPDRRRADRLFAVAPGAGRPESRHQPAAFRPPRTRQPDAQKTARSPPQTRADTAAKPCPTGDPMEPRLNRTAVGLSRPSAPFWLPLCPTRLVRPTTSKRIAPPRDPREGAARSMVRGPHEHFPNAETAPTGQRVLAALPRRSAYLYRLIYQIFGRLYQAGPVA